MSRPGPAQVNAYRVSEWLPPQIRRVAVLPLTADTADPALEAGLVPLEPVLRSELAKCDLFELVFVPAEQMRRWTGQRNWTAEETLPVDFFKRLQEEYGCNAVLFSRLTRYQAYAPLQMGWNLKLIESENPRIRWAVDEVFDAGQAAVADEAKRYAAHNLSDGRPLADGGSILMSPTRFGQYSISSVLGTLPKR